MTLALVSHIADSPTQLRVWVGIADRAAVAPADLVWTLAGDGVVPVAERPLTAWQIPGRKPFYSGTFVFDGLAPNSLEEVGLTVGAETIARHFKTLPQAVPTAGDESFKLLLVSCFHSLEDVTGTAGRLLSQHKIKPDITILAGDQVYLDLPTVRNFEDNSQWLEAKFQDDYLNNWFGDRSAARGKHEIPAGYPQLMALAPITTMPDDHEYWNNAPFFSPFIQNSWTAAGRNRWRAAAELAFGAFQQGHPAPFGSPRTITIDPLTILMLDTRSQRNRGVGDRPDSLTMRQGPGDLLGKAGRQALTAWADSLVASAGQALPRYGVLVTGQSLFSGAAGKLKGNIADFEFPDYPADYQFMLAELERVSRAGLPLLCLTGDVHWGRMLRAATVLGGAPIFEVISSPTSLVSSVGADQVKTGIASLKGLFGRRDHWPRHNKHDAPPDRFGTAGAYTPRVFDLAPDRQAAMRGNNAVMLRFRRIGAGVDIDAEYIPLHADEQVNAADRWATRFTLQPQA